MKWLFLAASLASTYPLALAFRASLRTQRFAWYLVGLFPFVIDPLHGFMAIVSWADWPGYVKGIEITILDVLAIALLLSLPRSRGRPPFAVAAVLYFLAVLVAASQSEVTQSALFYPWQLLRMFLVYFVVARGCGRQRVGVWLLKGLAAGMVLQLVLVVYQRFGLSALQPSGSFAHQNLLGVISHMVVFPLFALLLAGQRGWYVGLGPLAGLLVIAMTASRATTGLAAACFLLVVVLSHARSVTAKKSIVVAGCLLAAAVLAPIALSSLERRFEAAPIEEGYDERAAFEAAARSMINDHPAGVGSNNYVVVANVAGYNRRAEVAPTATSLGAHVHNVYLLVTTETGYLGLATFCLLLAHVLARAVRQAFTIRDRRGDLMLGCAAALVAVYVQSGFEWIFVSFQTQYVFAICAGLIGGLPFAPEQRPVAWRPRPVDVRPGLVPADARR